MLSIGELSKQVQVKIPTIRYYESIGLIDQPQRTGGNQRRYDATAVERLNFVRHARALGFSIDEVIALMRLQGIADTACDEANEIAVAQLERVRAKMRRLERLECELKRLATGCNPSCRTQECFVLAALADQEINNSGI